MATDEGAYREVRALVRLGRCGCVRCPLSNAVGSGAVQAEGAQGSLWAGYEQGGTERRDPPGARGTGGGGGGLLMRSHPRAHRRAPRKP